MTIIGPRSKDIPTIQAWQHFLGTVHFLRGAADGFFGADTQLATRAFQRRVGLPADGIAGPKTFAAATGFDADGLGLLRRSRVHSKDVERWQRHLASTPILLEHITGVFDGPTKAGTEAYQCLHQLGADGIAGRQTLAAATAEGFVLPGKTPAKPPSAPAPEPVAEQRHASFGGYRADASPAACFEQQHEPGMPHAFRGEADNLWVTPQRAGERAGELRGDLSAWGITIPSPDDGVFGYRAQSAVRLIQEYARCDTQLPDLLPTGRLDDPTDRLLKQPGKLRWLDGSPGELNEAVLRLHDDYRDMLGSDPEYAALVDVEGSDTLPPGQWLDPRSQPTLLGIRSSAMSGTDDDTDLFLFLVEAKVFWFRGSTVYAPRHLSRPDPPMLVPGQHRYRLGWHHFQDHRRCYRAFRPYGRGILVQRLREGSLGPAERNATINVHWSGSGHSNWSGGCQVIAGDHYLSPDLTFRDCRNFCAATYSSLSDDSPAPRTKGAYNLLVDLFACSVERFSTGGTPLAYTLMPEDAFESLASTSLAQAYQRAKTLLLS
jgi:peptidoglycan hydrolase-like protein with peptidoglycan-binding domain